MLAAPFPRSGSAGLSVFRAALPAPPKHESVLALGMLRAEAHGPLTDVPPTLAAAAHLRARRSGRMFFRRVFFDTVCLLLAVANGSTTADQRCKGCRRRGDAERSLAKGGGGRARRGNFCARRRGHPHVQAAAWHCGDSG